MTGIAGIRAADPPILGVRTAAAVRLASQKLTRAEFEAARVAVVAAAGSWMLIFPLLERPTGTWRRSDRNHRANLIRLQGECRDAAVAAVEAVRAAGADASARGRLQSRRRALIAVVELAPGPTLALVEDALEGYP